MKRHKIKREKPESSGSFSREKEEHDLAYYIHDRVELMHQVFSALRPKDLKAMTPACIRHLSVDNIKELCTEELLGISSKRLCAILDGAEPPTDTESSLSASPERLETISLDSISSDEEILSQTSKKSKKKHRHRDKSEKGKKKKKSKSTDDDGGEQSKASRAGLTVLELLELQARARAIRAQLQQEQAAKQSTDVAVESSQDSSSDDEVLVKEEPPEVVEISSDDEKPSVAELEKEKQNTSTETENSQKVTKRINNLVITVPQSKPTRKIKLNRPKSNPAPAPEKATTSAESNKTGASAEKNKNIDKTNNIATVASKAAEKDAKMKEKLKKKQKKKDKKKAVDKDGSDHDEITLQLSDSEKLDLLEDLGHKNYDRVSSRSSEDSESSSSSSSESDDDNDDKNSRNIEETKEKDEVISDQNLEEKSDEQKQKDIEASDKPTDVNNDLIVDNTSKVESVEEIPSKDKDISDANSSDAVTIQKEVVNDTGLDKENSKTITIEEEQTPTDQNNSDKIQETEKVPEVEKVQDDVEDFTATNEFINEAKTQEVNNILNEQQSTEENPNETVQPTTNCEVKEVPIDENNELTNKKDLPSETNKESSSETNLQGKNDGDKQMSDGELSDRDSSEVEATELQPEVVCISDDEGNSKKSKKKHKKKEKKNKKEKKSKKNKSDFRSGSDQNFYKDGESNVNYTEGSISIADDNVSEPIVVDEDDIYEILELSDDSSCYEVEGTVLSKEPTAEEIEALSAKIDEIDRVEVVTEEEIREHERSLAEKNDRDEESDNVEQISWKDRYLGSTKVKRVLTTSNILNALRKKNKELKKKIEESKTKELEVPVNENVEIPEKPAETNLEEGSIDQYNTLQGSTKYVDPVKEPEEKDKETEEKEGVVTKEMRKDAKQLLKMYKRLLKYNDMNKQKDPNKKKKKKQKKKSKDSENVASVVNICA